eukprot:6216792-Ditylum_brightwellii.AAC.1
MKATATALAACLIAASQSCFAFSPLAKKAFYTPNVSQRQTSSSSALAAMEVDTETNTLTVSPIKSLDGTVTLPGSKSLSNRCLLLAALSDGETRVENLLESDDIRYMLEALDKMNVPVKRDADDDTAVT